MTAPATHPCDACGGSGVRVWHGPERECSVCLGAGCFPDRMPVADAIHDANTLALASPRYGDVREAKTWGLAALDASRTGWTLVAHAEAAARCAVNAARAAFRAVPGLRGE